MEEPLVTVIGGGLAGCEAAWQAARRGARVRLCEMRPARTTPAHVTAHLAEIVCSNSLKSDLLDTAPGLLKAEMRKLGSLLLEVAETVRVPAGGALAVDREEFARAVTARIESHPRIEVVREEVRELPARGPAVLATGPLTSDPLAEALGRLTGRERLYFFDAIAPIVDADTIDRSRVFAASRYDKGEGEYLNCPMDEETYRAFHAELSSAAKVSLRDFEKGSFFEGCLPIEEIARRGLDTLRFGPMKPVGLVDPRTGRMPHAVVQLRQDNLRGDLWNLVGFQTNLRHGEQQRILRMIPGLEGAEFFRLGSIHRNTYLNAPAVLLPTCQLRARPDLLVAGQLSGVEGYMDSAAIGLLAGTNAARLARGARLLVPPPETALGALCAYITGADPSNYQPMNISFGLFPPVADARGNPVHGRLRRKEAIVRRALAAMDSWIRAGRLADGSPPAAPEEGAP